MVQNILSNLKIFIAIPIFFLSINLSLGFYCGRGVKSIEGYVLGGRNFSTAALVSTVATCCTFILTAMKTNAGGRYDLILRCGLDPSALPLVSTTYFFLLRPRSFLKNSSVAEFSGKCYGAVRNMLRLTEVVVLILVLGRQCLVLTKKNISEIILFTEAFYLNAVASTLLKKIGDWKLLMLNYRIQTPEIAAHYFLDQKGG